MKITKMDLMAVLVLTASYVLVLAWVPYTSTRIVLIGLYGAAFVSLVRYWDLRRQIKQEEDTINTLEQGISQATHRLRRLKTSTEARQRETNPAQPITAP